MKIYTAKYKAEQPANKELHVPSDSRYGVGLQFERDGQPWDLLPSEVTLDGLSADDVVDGTFIFERTSGEYGQKVSDVRAADMGVHVSAESDVTTQSVRKNIVAPVSFSQKLSSVISEPVEVAYDQFNFFFRENDGSAPEGEYVNTKGRVIATVIELGESHYPQIKFGPASFEDKFWLYADAQQPYGVPVKSVLLTPDSTILYSYSTRVTQTVTRYKQTKLTIDTADTIRNYKLTETTEDQGIVLGFNEKYVLKDTIELSGTNADDTTFSYTLPITD